MTAAAPNVGGAGALADWIAPGRTALVIIDMQVDVALAEGALGRTGVDLAAIGPAVAAAERLAASARAAGVPVVFVGLQTDASRDSAAWRERMLRRGDSPDAAFELCRAGSRGADFVGPTPWPGEVVIAKARYSGFFGTTLDAELKALGVDTLVVCGLTTECCVDCTVRDAFQLDYHVFIASDACAAYEPALHEAALTSLALNCAILAGAGALIAAWSEDE